MKLETKITELRKKSEITQDELSERLGYTTPQMVSNWERGRCQIPAQQFLPISRILKITIKEMVLLRIEDETAKLQMSLK